MNMATERIILRGVKIKGGESYENNDPGGVDI